MKQALLVLVLAAASFGAGYWPQHQKLADAEQRLLEEQARLRDAEARVRAGELLGRMLNLLDAASARNYGDAQQLSTAFFDAVRAEASRAPAATLSKALDGILGMRDSVTAAIVRSDPASVELLRQAESSLRQALGYAPMATHSALPEAVAPLAPAALPAAAATPSPSPVP